LADESNRRAVTFEKWPFEEASLSDLESIDVVPLLDDNGCVAKIVEEADATSEEKTIKETNSSIYCFDTGKLLGALRRLQPNNQQGEYYPKYPPFYPAIIAAVPAEKPEPASPAKPVSNSKTIDLKDLRSFKAVTASAVRLVWPERSAFR
jgi:hypothetical protein